MQLEVGVQVGSVGVRTTNHRDYTPQEWAEMAANRIITIGDQSHPAIRDQAHAFKKYIERIIAATVEQAVASDRLYRK